MTSSINFLGSYSGIDQTTIDSLMEVERLPLKRLAIKQTSYSEKKNAWNDVNTRLNTLFEKVKALQSKDVYSAKAASSTDENIVTMTPSNNTVVGDYKIHVNQIATNTSIISGDIALAAGDSSADLGITGTFTISNSEAVDVNINITATDSLRDIVGKINGETKNSGISATVIDNRLVISDQTTGDRNITLTDDVNGTLGKLGLDTTKTINQGKNALFNVNGIDVERTTNTVEDVVLDTTINLMKEHEVGQYETVSVSSDTGKMTEAVQAFVDQYNATMSFIDGLLEAGDPKVEGSGGKLAGDSTLMRLQSSIRSYATSAISNSNTDISDISELGVSTFDKTGQLKFDSSKLVAALEKDVQNVVNFFISEDTENNEIGFSSRLKNYVDNYISSSSGIIKGKTESIERILKDVTDQIDVFNDRMERKEQYYVKVFSALDVAMAEAEDQMSWLQNQLNSMNSMSSSN